MTQVASRNKGPRLLENTGVLLKIIIACCAYSKSGVRVPILLLAPIVRSSWPSTGGTMARAVAEGEEEGAAVRTLTRWFGGYRTSRYALT